MDPPNIRGKNPSDEGSMWDTLLNLHADMKNSQLEFQRSMRDHVTEIKSYDKAVNTLDEPADLWECYNYIIDRFFDYQKRSLEQDCQIEVCYHFIKDLQIFDDLKNANQKLQLEHIATILSSMICFQAVFRQTQTMYLEKMKEISHNLNCVSSCEDLRKGYDFVSKRMLEVRGYLVKHDWQFDKCLDILGMKRRGNKEARSNPSKVKSTQPAKHLNVDVSPMLNATSNELSIQSTSPWITMGGSISTDKPKSSGIAQGMSTSPEALPRVNSKSQKSSSGNKSTKQRRIPKSPTLESADKHSFLASKSSSLEFVVATPLTVSSNIKTNHKKGALNVSKSPTNSGKLGQGPPNPTKRFKKDIAEDNYSPSASRHLIDSFKSLHPADSTTTHSQKKISKPEKIVSQFDIEQKESRKISHPSLLNLNVKFVHEMIPNDSSKLISREKKSSTRKMAAESTRQRVKFESDLQTPSPRGSKYTKLPPIGQQSTETRETGSNNVSTMHEDILTLFVERPPVTKIKTPLPSASGSKYRPLPSIGSSLVPKTPKAERIKSAAPHRHFAGMKNARPPRYL